MFYTQTGVSRPGRQPIVTDGTLDRMSVGPSTMAGTPERRGNGDESHAIHASSIVVTERL